MQIYTNDQGVEYAIIEVAPNEFVSMLKSDYEATLAANSAPTA